VSNIVAIVGRPNVGKSTLFNRLIGSRKAIVDDTSGVTRDRQYNFAEWSGKEFIVVDTGGYVENSRDIFEKEIKKQVEIAINEAQVILFMVDVSIGITDLDETFVRYLRKVKKPIIVVANKTDNFNKIPDTYEFYKLGFEHVIPVSAINGTGSGELLDKILEFLPDNPEPQNTDQTEIPKFAIIGKPNVGKSTLINMLLGEERNIVSDIPGTTRDAIHSVYNKFGKNFIIIDTAGLRKKTNVHEDIEFYSVIRAIKSIEESDVCLLLLDASENISSQDLSIISLVERRKKGLVILLNKWDIIEKDPKAAESMIAEIKQKISPFEDVPIITTSAKNKVRLMKAIEEALKVYENKTRKITTSELNRVMQEAINTYHPPSVKGKFVNIKYVTQVSNTSPAFSFFCNHPKYIKDSYKRYLENKLRENFDFKGVPMTLLFKKK